MLVALSAKPPGCSSRKNFAADNEDEVLLSTQKRQLRRTKMEQLVKAPKIQKS
jgi:hypothetical protein